MDIINILNTITAFVGLILCFVVIIREKKGNHHWLHYVPVGMVGININMLLDRVIFPSVDWPSYISVSIMLINYFLGLGFTVWIYNNGKKIREQKN